MIYANDPQVILVFGAGGHAKVLIDILEKQKTYRIVAVIDESPKAADFLGYPVQSFETKWPALRGIVAVGDNHARRRLAERILATQPSFRFVSAVHPSAQIARDVRMGDGTAIMAGVTVNTSAEIGSHCILNTQSSVDHDAKIGSFASLGPGAITGGLVEIGEGAAVALGALCLHKVRIGREAVVGAGSVVTRDVPEKTVAYGNPCRPVRSREAGDRYL